MCCDHGEPVPIGSIPEYKGYAGELKGQHAELACLYFFPSHSTFPFKMKYTLASAVAILAAAVKASLVFMVSTEPGNKGIQKSWVTDRWVCM